MNFDVPLSPSTRLAAPSDSQPGAGHVQASASPAGGRRIGTAVLCALALAASLAACSKKDAAPAATAKAATEVGVVTLQKQSQQLDATLPGRFQRGIQGAVVGGKVEAIKVAMGIYEHKGLKLHPNE